jgi:hypothetical protein
VPSQRRPHTGSPGVALHAAWFGSGWPTIGVQVPSLPETLHASHDPVHDVEQQKPSTQLLLAHSAAAAQVEPASFLQVPLVSGVASHDAPAPQVPVAQQTPSVQKPLGHALASAHVAPRPSMGTHKPPLQ